jgi:thiol-disulfide isomerase/thioredoxin
LYIVAVAAVAYAVYYYFNSTDADDKYVQMGGATDVPTLTLYYAPWCGHCKRFMPEWEKVEAALKGRGDIIVRRVNGDESPEEMKANKVTGFPTIIMSDGSRKFVYDGKRDAPSVLDFAQNRLHGYI